MYRGVIADIGGEAELVVGIIVDAALTDGFEAQLVGSDAVFSLYVVAARRLGERQQLVDKGRDATRVFLNLLARLAPDFIRQLHIGMGQYLCEA